MKNIKTQIIFAVISLAMSTASISWAAPKSPEAGDDDSHTYNCSSGAEDIVIDVINRICKEVADFKCVDNVQPYCAFHTRELFTGTDLANFSGKANPTWNYQGGRGQILSLGAGHLLRPLTGSATAKKKSAAWIYARSKESAENLICTFSNEPMIYSTTTIASSSLRASKQPSSH